MQAGGGASCSLCTAMRARPHIKGDELGASAVAPAPVPARNPHRPNPPQRTPHHRPNPPRRSFYQIQMRGDAGLASSSGAAPLSAASEEAAVSAVGGVGVIDNPDQVRLACHCQEAPSSDCVTEMHGVLRTAFTIACAMHVKKPQLAATVCACCLPNNANRGGVRGEQRADDAPPLLPPPPPVPIRPAYPATALLASAPLPLLACAPWRLRAMAQRICDDVTSFVRSSVSIGLSLCRKVFNCVAFAGRQGKPGREEGPAPRGLRTPPHKAGGGVGGRREGPGMAGGGVGGQARQTGRSGGYLGTGGAQSGLGAGRWVRRAVGLLASRGSFRLRAGHGGRAAKPSQAKPGRGGARQPSDQRPAGPAPPRHPACGSHSPFPAALPPPLPNFSAPLSFLRIANLPSCHATRTACLPPPCGVRACVRAGVLWSVSGQLVVLLFVYAGVGTAVTTYVFGRVMTDLYYM